MKKVNFKVMAIGWMIPLAVSVGNVIFFDPREGLEGIFYSVQGFVMGMSFISIVRYLEFDQIQNGKEKQKS